MQNAPTEEIKNALLKIHGVGPKVADCVLLFGFSRLEIFPLDVWMKRVMTSMYPSGFPPEIKEYAGLAQQFLFHYARNIKTVGVAHHPPAF
jgi:N-glycosylase/DNA lyase